MSKCNLNNEFGDSKDTVLQNDNKLLDFQTNYESIFHIIDEQYAHSVCFKESLNIFSENNINMGKFLVDIDKDKDSCGITYLVFLSFEEKVNGVNHFSTVSSRINSQFITLEEKRVDSLQFGNKKIECEVYLLNEGDFYSATLNSFDGKNWKKDDLEIPIQGSTVLLGEGANYLYLRYLAQSGTRKSANFLVLLNDGSLHISEYVSRKMGMVKVGRNKKEIETMSVKKLVHNPDEQQITEWTLIKGSGYILEEKREIPLGSLKLPGYHEEEEYKSEEEEEDFDDEEFRALLVEEKDKKVDMSFIEEEKYEQETIPEKDTYDVDGVVIIELVEEDAGSREEGLSEGELPIIEEITSDPSDTEDKGEDIEDVEAVVIKELVEEDVGSREEMSSKGLSEREIPIIITSERGSEVFEAYPTEITEEYIEEEKALKPEGDKTDTFGKKDSKYNVEEIEEYETEKAAHIDDEGIERDTEDIGADAVGVAITEVVGDVGSREEIPSKVLSEREIPIIIITSERGSESYPTEITEEYVEEGKALKPEGDKTDTLGKKDSKYIVEEIEEYETEKAPHIDDEAIERDTEDIGPDPDGVVITEVVDGDAGSREEIPSEGLSKREIPKIIITSERGTEAYPTEITEEYVEEEKALKPEGDETDTLGKKDSKYIVEEIEEYETEKAPHIDDEAIERDTEDIGPDPDGVVITEVVDGDAGSREEIPSEVLSEREFPTIEEIASERRYTGYIEEDVDEGVIIELVDEDEGSREDIGEDVEAVVVIEVVEEGAGSREEIPSKRVSEGEIPIIAGITSERGSEVFEAHPTEITEEYVEEEKVLKPEGEGERLDTREGIVETEHEKTPAESEKVPSEKTSEFDEEELKAGEEGKKVAFVEEEREVEVSEEEEEAEEEEGEGEEEEAPEEKEGEEEEEGEGEEGEVPEEEAEGEGSDVGEEERGEVEEEEDIGEGEREGAEEEGEIGEGGGKFGEGGERGEREGEVEDMKEALEKRKQLEYARYVWPDMTEEESEEELKLEDILADVERLQEECKKIKRHIRGMVTQGEEWRLKWRGSTIKKEPLVWKMVEGARRIAVHKKCLVMDDGKVDQSPVPLEYRWREDPELMSAYRSRKVRRKMDIRSYLTKHEEIRDMISDFLLHIFLQKPENVIDFSIEYFTTFKQK